MTNQQLLAIAQEYRERYQDNHPCMLSSGYVRIYQGEAYGWYAEKGEANTECPEALLVSLTGDIFEAVGGDKLKGAKKWQPYKKE
ncbi:hypothetical protein DGCBELOO_02002 [Mannheimia haemolytica]|uniref:hypothetical protein n=1 Tax=Mannheimia haemolytica TaxID=75985 RepID=UPI0031F499FC